MDDKISKNPIGPRKFRFSTVMVVAFLIASILPLAIVMTVSFINSQTILEEEIIKEREEVVKQEVDKINIFLDNFKVQTLVLTDLPPAQGIIRSEANDGVDPLDGSTSEAWKERFQIIFISMIEVDKNIDHIRFIDENGNEIVRVDNEDGIPKVTPENELQKKVDRYYFKEAIKLNKDQIYVSPLDLNVEQDEIEIPHKPIIRVTTPIFNAETNELKGIVLMNIKGDIITEVTEAKDIGDKIIIDQDGFFLFTPKEERKFSKDLDTGYNYFEEHPEFEEHMGKFDALNYFDEEVHEFRIWKKIFYNPSNQEEYWVLISRVDEEVLLSSVIGLRNILFAISFGALVLVVAFAFFVSRLVSKPLGKLTSDLEQITKGNLDIQLESSKINEVNRLISSLNRILASMKLAILKTGLSKGELGIGEAIRQKKEAEEKYKALYDSSRDAIMTLDPKTGRFTSGNPATIKMFGVKDEKEFTSKTPDQLSPKKQPDGTLSTPIAKKKIMKAMKEGSNFFEWTHKRIDGEEFPATVLLTRVKISGKEMLQATVRDLSISPIKQLTKKKPAIKKVIPTKKFINLGKKKK